MDPFSFIKFLEVTPPFSPERITLMTPPLVLRLADRDAFIVQLPVERPPHHITCLRFIVEVLITDHINHRTHDTSPIKSDAFCRGEYNVDGNR